MSFGFGGGSNTSGGFGFGSNNNNTTTTSGGSLFGGGTATSGGFGGSTTGFGGTNTGSPAFGQSKSGFGATTGTTAGGSMFGGSAPATGGFGGGGGFGASTNTGSSTPFGAANTNTASGSIFGQKPATTGFGSTNNTTGGSLFGGGSATGGFGSTNTTTPSNPFASTTSTTANTGFGGSSTPAFGTGTANASTFSSGFGANNAAAANTSNQGTAVAPFNAHSEKDTGTNTTSVYQSITMQQAYQNKSFEELRVEDYMQNRRFPQSGSFGSGSTFGGFGQNNTTQPSTGGMFGGGATSTPAAGGFGGSTTGFGGSNTGTGFGSNTNTGGGLFGQSKPATGGLFGNTPASSGAATGGFGQTAGSTGGLFGGNNAQTNTGGGLFGSQNNTTTGGGLFGGQQNQQAKPAFGGFGQTNTANTASTGFGGGFGQNNQQQAQQPASNPFGASTNTGGAFGGSTTGGGLFGGQNNQAKPAATGLFGSTANTNTGGGLFGSNNATQTNTGTTGGGLFGGSQNTNTGGSLFGGNNQNKPATGLFGSSTGATNTGGSLFGGNQSTNTGGSLFGGAQSNNNAGSSLFGGQQNKPAGSSLFGGNTGNTGGSLFGGSQNAGSSLFGGNNQNQNQGNSLFGGNNANQNQNAGSSMFGGSTQNQQQTNQLTASINSDPYGNAQLFATLAAPSPPVGPLATPLSGARPAPKARASLLSSVRGSSPMLSASTSLTPRGRPGYGFSYSTYSSPVAGTSSLTPGAINLLRPTASFNSSLTGRLSKSFSTSNLRAEGVAGDGTSMLRTPVAGQSSLLLGTGSLGSGSVRRLKIDRSLRTDLFGESPRRQLEGGSQPEGQQTPQAQQNQPDLRKRVSFDRTAERDNSNATPRASASNALVVREDDEENTANGTSDNTRDRAPEMSQVNGPSLSTVHEEPAANDSQQEVDDSGYWTEPPMKHLKKMSRNQLQHMRSFTVGRRGIGKIEFGTTGTVDLSSVTLDDICGKIVLLNPRSATVYKETSIPKPPVGRGLNVPSLIRLENTWHKSKRTSSSTPQNKSAESLDKEIARHVVRLKRVGGTHFKSYDSETGIWEFTVDHYTTYAFDDSEDEDGMEDDTGMLDLQPKIPDTLRTTSSGLSEPPATGASGDRSFGSSMEGMDSPELGEEDDTFQFKRLRQSQQSNLSVPGGFDGDDSMANVTYDCDDPSADEMQDEHIMSGGLGDADMEDPFIEAGGAVQAPSPGAMDRYHSSLMEDDEQADEPEVEQIEKELPGSFTAQPAGLKSILKPTAAAYPAFASPQKVTELSWEDQLQRTLSPKKRDRQALRGMQESVLRTHDLAAEESPFKKSLLSRSQLGQSYLATKSAKKGKAAAPMASAKDLDKSQAFKTSMDIMNSLWADEKGAKKTKAGFGEMSNPSKRPRVSTSEMDNQDTAYHQSFKPSFSSAGTLIYSVSGPAQASDGVLREALKPLVGQHRDVRFAQFEPADDIEAPALRRQQEATEITVAEDGISMPLAVFNRQTYFGHIEEVVVGTSPSAIQEKAIWKLCSILGDPIDAFAQDLMTDIPEDDVDELDYKLTLDAFRAFWTKDVVAGVVSEQLKNAKSAQEKALLHLVAGDVFRACEVVMEAGDFRLATLLSQLPGNQTSRSLMDDQINGWKERNDWSEFSDAHRALYSILAGETCTVSGSKAGAAKEDLTREFSIADRFGLTWTESLSLRVQYAAHDRLQETVAEYLNDLKDGKERAQPTPWHGRGDGAEDTLLSLLRYKVNPDATDCDAMLDPTTVSANAMSTRLTWQLASTYKSIGFPGISDDKMDVLTLDFAAELERAGVYTTAAWVLLHLNNDTARFEAIKALFERNAASISDPVPEDEDGNPTGAPGSFERLAIDLAIPTHLIWAAKALYAQSVLRVPEQHCTYLIYAGTEPSCQEAHDVLCRTVGPQAVIEREYHNLAALLGEFETFGVHNFYGWTEGGKVYADFVRLQQLAVSKRQGSQGEKLIRDLRKGLNAMSAKGSQGVSLEMRVAVIEMRAVVEEAAKEFEEPEVKAKARQRKGKSGKGQVGEVEDMGWGMLEGYRRALGEVV